MIILKIPIALLQVPLGMLWLDGDDADRAENLAAQEVFWGPTDIFNGVEAFWNHQLLLLS